jgi:hypothetical protein
MAGVAGHFLPYYIAAAQAIQWSVATFSNSSLQDDVRLSVRLGELIGVALAPIVWTIAVFWFALCANVLRRWQAGFWVWCAWGAATVSVSYVLLLLLLFPKSDVGRMAVFNSQPWAAETLIGIVSSSAIGAIVGAVLFVLCPKWPRKPLGAIADPVKAG